MANLYRKQVTNLISLLTQDNQCARAAEIIRSLVEEIILTPVVDKQAGKAALGVSI